jgi:hypothetical protein
VTTPAPARRQVGFGKNEAGRAAPRTGRAEVKGPGRPRGLASTNQALNVCPSLANTAPSAPIVTQAPPGEYSPAADDRAASEGPDRRSVFRLSFGIRSVGGPPLSERAAPRWFGQAVPAFPFLLAGRGLIGGLLFGSSPHASVDPGGAGHPVSAHLIPQIGECVRAFVAVASPGLSRRAVPTSPDYGPPAYVAFRSHLRWPAVEGRPRPRLDSEGGTRREAPRRVLDSVVRQVPFSSVRALIEGRVPEGGARRCPTATGSSC